MQWLSLSVWCTNVDMVNAAPKCTLSFYTYQASDFFFLFFFMTLEKCNYKQLFEAAQRHRSFGILWLASTC